MSFFWLALFSYLFEKDSILKKGEDAGFFYKNVEISEVSDCNLENDSLCIKHNGKNFLVKKKDGFTANIATVKNSVNLNITPDPAYISYFLYIQTECDVHKVKLTKREIVISEKSDRILRLQIVGTGVNGPEILWGKKLNETKLPKFSASFDNSLNLLRKQCKRQKISIDNKLEEAALSSLAKVQNEGLKHYSSKDGSIRHSGIRKKTLGENLFTAKNESEAWEMLVSSPAHFYNLINPHFLHYFYAIKKDKEEVIGAIVFSE